MNENMANECVAIAIKTMNPTHTKLSHSARNSFIEHSNVDQHPNSIAINFILTITSYATPKSFKCLSMAINSFYDIEKFSLSALTCIHNSLSTIQFKLCTMYPPILFAK